MVVIAVSNVEEAMVVDFCVLLCTLGDDNNSLKILSATKAKWILKLDPMKFLRHSGVEQEYLGVFQESLGTFCGVDDQFVPKIGMTFNTLEDAAKFYKDYSKVTGFSTRVRSTNKKKNEIKNQLTTYSREKKWKSKISPTEKTNPSAGLNCLARIYIHVLKDIGVWIISKVVNWDDFLLKYGLVDNKWLSDLYEDCHIWVPIYLDHHFWVGMRSTQRRKNMHSFLTSSLPGIARLSNLSNNMIIASEVGSKERENRML
ncbi:hypothetical protein Ahy_B03g063925 [Arachis hypogaea]|uniref:Uncharacterized protein n=1 Tax=Arachis hypogaea TaxID=3818 RepID=A0A444ZYF8_ARAHY|nr:hypothetical protein Ahy_B03g063925 [Arachis hypogaea]